MKITALISLLALPLAALAAQKRAAAIYPTTPSFIIPWTPLAQHSVDQSIIFNNTYYLADRNNKGVQVIDLISNTHIGVITGGFVVNTLNGTSTIDSDSSGPNGLVALPDRGEMYVGDGDGTIKVVDLKTNKIIYTYPNISTKRADELAYDGGVNGIIVATSPAEDIPYITVISAIDRKVLGKIEFTGATEIDQPTYNPVNGLFYVAVPSVPNTKAAGGQIAVLDIKNMSIGSVILTPECFPFGIVFGPPNHLFVGCGPPQRSVFGHSASYVIDVTTGSIIGNISGIGGIDQVAYSPATNSFYGAAVALRPSPVVAIVSAKDNMLVQTLVTDNITAHVVAVDAMGDLLVPISLKGVLRYNVLSNGTVGMNATSIATATGSGTKPSGSSPAVVTTNVAGEIARSLTVVLGMAACVALLAM